MKHWQRINTSLPSIVSSDLDPIREQARMYNNYRIDLLANGLVCLCRSFKKEFSFITSRKLLVAALIFLPERPLMTDRRRNGFHGDPILVEEGPFCRNVSRSASSLKLCLERERERLNHWLSRPSRGALQKYTTVKSLCQSH